MAIDGERDPTIAGEEDEEDDECVDLEPFFYDEAAVVAKAAEKKAAAAEKRRLQEESAAREAAERAVRMAADQAVLDRITERDPETGHEFYTRYHEEDFSGFDIDEVSPIPPMRFTAAVYSPAGDARIYFQNMVNVLAVRIIIPSASDDDVAGDSIPFPIAVYGSVIARDDLDRKCLPLFRLSRDDPHIITSKDDSLILIGPHRGIILEDVVYFEIDLKLKDDRLDGVVEDRQLSKGLLMLNGIILESSLLLQQKLFTAVQGITLDRRISLNRLYPVRVMYAFVSDAVEATISVKVLQGHFYGKITACTSRVKDIILLHDSSLVRAAAAADHIGNDGQFDSVVPLFRSVMAIFLLHEKLTITIVALADGTRYTRRTLNFAPAVNGGGEAKVTCGVNSFLVKVNWSLMNPPIDEET